jgi:PAP2 superfamily C-terminal
MKRWIKSYKTYVRDGQFLFSLGIALLFFIGGLITTYYAILYATESASAPVTDIILSNIRVYNVDGIFIYGPVIYWVITGLYIISKPQKMPFALESIATFLFVRAIFISLTHIGPFPGHLEITGAGIFAAINRGSDLFFSSHTGLPFLIAIVFWDNKRVRYLSLFSSLLFAVVVLMGHLHYSIDVFAAFFITYGIAHIAEWFFREDKQLFDHGIQGRHGKEGFVV